MAATVLIWAGFAVSIRAIGMSPLTSADVALIRFAVPAIAFLPWLPSRLTSLRHLPVRDAAMIAMGAGLPFFLIAAAGGKLTSAAHVGALVAGTTPLSVALLSFALYRHRIGPDRTIGLAVILAGVGLLVAGLVATGGSVVAGVTLLATASLLWGGYTISVRRANLDPIGCAMVVTYPSLLILVASMALGAVPSHLSEVHPSEMLPFVMVQGIGVGTISVIAYATAIRHLGALRCATCGALAPVLATMIAAPVLGELPSVQSAVGVGIVAIGVLLFNLNFVRKAS